MTKGYQQIIQNKGPRKTQSLIQPRAVRPGSGRAWGTRLILGHPRSESAPTLPLPAWLALAPHLTSSLAGATPPSFTRPGQGTSCLLCSFLNNLGKLLQSCHIAHRVTEEAQSSCISVGAWLSQRLSPKGMFSWWPQTPDPPVDTPYSPTAEHWVAGLPAPMFAKCCHLAAFWLAEPHFGASPAQRTCT